MALPCIPNYSGEITEVLSDDDTILGWTLYPPMTTPPDYYGRPHTISFLPHNDRSKSTNRHNGYMLLSNGTPHEVAESLCRGKLKSPFKITIARKAKLVQFNNRLQGKPNTLGYDTFRRWAKVEENGAMRIANRIITYHGFLQEQIGSSINQKTLWDALCDISPPMDTPFQHHQRMLHTQYPLYTAPYTHCSLPIVLYNRLTAL